MSSGTLCAQLDEQVLRCDFLIIGKVLSDSTSTSSWNRGVTAHYCNIVITQVCVANWNTVSDTAPPTAGSTIYNVRFNTTDSNFRFPTDSLLFLPVMAVSHKNYYMQNVERDYAAFSDTSLFSEYCVRKNPEAHLPFPIIIQEKYGKWERTSQYTADSVLVMSFDRKGKRHVSYSRRTKYSSNGQVTDIDRIKVKQQRGSIKTIKWCFKRDGKRCFSRQRTRIPLFH